MNAPDSSVERYAGARVIAAPPPAVAADARLGRLDAAFAGSALLAGALLLYLGRSLTFWDDEWRSITFDGSGLDYLKPVNQHWWTVPLLLYRGTFAVVELNSYIPYLAQVVILHLAAVAGAYALMRRRLGQGRATVASIPLLVLGAGAENLFWAFQTGFVASVLFGVWALFFLECSGRRTAVAASVLLVAGLASSGMGTILLVVAAGRTLLDPALRGRVLAVAPPALVYFAWFLVFGQGTVDEGRRLFLESGVVGFVVRGVAFSTQQTLGVGFLADGEIVGLLVFLALTALTGLRVVHGRSQGLAAGCLLGVVAMYIVVGLARLHDDPGYDHAVAGRFVYVAAFLFVLAAVDLVPRPGEWSARGPRVGLPTASVLLVAAGCSVTGNIAALADERARFEAEATRTRAFVAVALARGSDPWVDRTSPRDWMPSVAELEGIVERHGSPVRDSWFPGVAAEPDAEAREEALLALAGDDFRVEAPSESGSLTAAELRARGRAVVQRGRCVTAAVAPAAALWLIGLPPRARVRVTSARAVDAQVFLAHVNGPGRRIFAELEAGDARDIVVPYVGDNRSWNVVIDSPGASASVTSCVRVPNRSSSRSFTGVVRRW